MPTTLKYIFTKLGKTEYPTVQISAEIRTKKNYSTHEHDIQKKKNVAPSII